MREQGSILVVDRDPAFTETARLAGDLVDREIVFALNMRAGLQRARDQKPDLIILGYLEPPGEAYRLHKELRECSETKDIPLLVVDVRAEGQPGGGWHKAEGVRMDAEDYLRRPISAQKLALHIQSVLSAGKSGEEKKMETPLHSAQKVDLSLVAAQAMARRDLHRVKGNRK